MVTISTDYFELAMDDVITIFLYSYFLLCRKFKCDVNLIYSGHTLSFTSTNLS